MQRFQPARDRIDAIISTTDLTKTYTFHKQEAGIRGATKSLFKRTYESRLAVDAISMNIRPGEIVGFLGPNGAGKTTTLKMLSGLLHPTSGNVSVLGHTPAHREDAYLKRISLVMGQKTMLWWDVPAMETFLLHKDMYDLPDATFRASVDELADLLDVRDLLDVQVRKLSLGERMKMELMAALLHRPEVVFLDEPTIGLDVVAKARVREFLRDVNAARGTTIVITSHDMDDIEALCERIILINHGRIEYGGALTDLVRQIQPGKRIRAVYGGPVETTVFDRNPGVEVIREDDGRILRLDVPRDHLTDVLATVPTLGDLQDMAVSDADVDDIIREVFTRGKEVRS